MRNDRTYRATVELDLIGSLLYRADEYKNIRARLREDLFFDELSRKLYRGIELCFERGIEISYANVAASSHLTTEEQAQLIAINAIGGDPGVLVLRLCEIHIEYLILQTRTIASSNLDVFKKLLSLESVIARCNEVLESQRAVNNEVMYQHFRDWVTLNLRQGENRIKTGLTILDKILGGGLNCGDLSVVGGVPGAGKTSFMLQVALSALKQGVAVSLLEGEMTREQILVRMNAIDQGVPMSEIRSGRRLEDATGPFVSRMRSLPFYLVECIERTPEELGRKIGYFASVKRCSLVLVDYLQIFASLGRGQSEYEAVSIVSRDLRRLALKLNIHILAASSLNRLHVVRGEKPGLQSLRSSGQLGHDAAVAMFLLGEEDDDAELVGREREIELQVAKNRDGPRGKIRIDYHLDTQRMCEK